MTDSPRAEADKTALVVLPYEMSARSVLHTPVGALLAAHPGLAVVLVSRDEQDRLAQPSMRWYPLYRPFRRTNVLPRWRPLLLLDGLRFGIGFALHLCAVYRFNVIHGFRGFACRLRQSWRLRRVALGEGIPLSRCFGFPFPRAASLLRWIRARSTGRWQAQPSVEALFERVRPDLVAVFHTQNHFAVPYVLAAHRRGIPVLGVNGSWDHPILRGPLIPHLDRLLAQSPFVRDCLNVHHGVDPSQITIVGWPQMDIYAAAETIRPRVEFLSELGLDPERRLILFGAYGSRLGAHEDTVCRLLAERLRAGALAPNTTLYIRGHPLDSRFDQTLGLLHDPPWVVVERPELGRPAHLANLLAHAAVVICSGGTIGMEAIALDTPVVMIGWEDPALPYFDRPARRYETEHLAAVLETGGIRLADSAEDTLSAVARYLNEPGTDADGRAALRAEHLAPLDGWASERLVNAIAQAVGLPPVARD